MHTNCIFIKPPEDRANSATSDTSVGQWGGSLRTWFKRKRRGSQPLCGVGSLVLLKFKTKNNTIWVYEGKRICLLTGPHEGKHGAWLCRMSEPRKRRGQPSLGWRGLCLSPWEPQSKVFLLGPGLGSEQELRTLGHSSKLGM